MITHGELLKLVKHLDSDFEPYGKRSREADYGPDCSCGCRYFVPLEGNLGLDWWVCVNPKSPRCGLLTFEHQGCREFEEEDEAEKERFLKGLGVTIDERGFVHFPQADSAKRD